MTQHLEEGVLHGLLDGEISAAELAPVNAHLAGCAECRARLEEARAFRDEAERLVSAIEVPADVSPPADVVAIRRPRRVPLRTMAYAATLVAALGLGYGARGWVGEPEAVRPARSDSPAEQRATPEADESGRALDQSRPRAAERSGAMGERTLPSAGGSGIVSSVRRPVSAPDTTVAAARSAPPAANRSELVPSSRAAERQAAAKLAQEAPPQRRVEGKVTNETGQGVGGARVQVVESGLAAATDSLGRYRLEGNLPDQPTLVVRAIGHQALTKPADLGDSGVARLDFTLRIVPYRLEEITTQPTGVAPSLDAPRRSLAASRTRLGGASFAAIDFAEAIRRLGGRIRLVDGMVPWGVEAAGDTVRVAYQVSGVRGILYLQQFRSGDTVAFAMIPPPGFPADSLARITARVKP